MKQPGVNRAGRMMMAYMVDGKGPYPNKAGEYCGNHRGCKATIPENMRIGRPCPCKAGTTAEREAQGYVGLYLKEDRKLMDWEEECETPPELTEPEASKGD